MDGESCASPKARTHAPWSRMKTMHCSPTAAAISRFAEPKCAVCVRALLRNETQLPHSVVDFVFPSHHPTTLRFRHTSSPLLFKIHLSYDCTRSRSLLSEVELLCVCVSENYIRWKTPYCMRNQSATSRMTKYHHEPVFLLSVV